MVAAGIALAGAAVQWLLGDTANWFYLLVIIGGLALMWMGEAWARWVPAFFLGIAGLLGLLSDTGSLFSLTGGPGELSHARERVAVSLLANAAKAIVAFLLLREPCIAFAWRLVRSDWSRSFPPPAMEQPRVGPSGPQAERLKAAALRSADNRDAVSTVVLVFIALVMLIGAVALVGSVISAHQMVKEVGDELAPMAPTSPSMTYLKAGGGLWDAFVGVFVSVAFFAMFAVYSIIIVLVAYLMFFVIPFLMVLPVIGPVAIMWRSPARFLLLRPFDRGRLTRVLAHVVRREIGPLGHTYTLADRAVHVPWFVRVPLLFGQLAIFSYRFSKIRHSAHLNRFCRMLRRTSLRNLNWLLSPSRMFPIACVDEGWRAVVSRLSREVDLILIDVTGANENVLWELEECRRLGLSSRLVLISEASDAASGKHAQALLRNDEQLRIYGDSQTSGHLRDVLVERLIRLGGPGSFTPPVVESVLADRMWRRSAIRAGVLGGACGMMLLFSNLTKPPALESVSNVALGTDARMVDILGVEDGGKDVTLGWKEHIALVNVAGQNSVDVRTLPGEPLAATPRGTTVASRDGFRLLLTRGSEQIEVPSEPSFWTPTRAAFDHGGHLLAIARPFSDAELRDETGNLRGTLSPARYLAFSPSGDALAILGDQRISIWSIPAEAKPVLLQQFAVDEEARMVVSKFEWRDEDTIAILGDTEYEDTETLLVDTRTGRVRRIDEAVLAIGRGHGIVFLSRSSPNDKAIAKTRAGKWQLKYGGEDPTKWCCHEYAFSPDGRAVVALVNDHLVLWKLPQR